MNYKWLSVNIIPGAKPVCECLFLFLAANEKAVFDMSLLLFPGT